MTLFDTPIPFEAGRREARAGGYNDLIVQAALAAAQGTAATHLQAAVETCAGLWERGLSSGSSDKLSRRQLGLIGRSLLIRGECLYPIDGGAVAPSPASIWTVRGTSGDPRKWTYQITTVAPSGTRTVLKAGTDVLHVRIGVIASRPWAGCSPLANSAGTRAILAALEQSMAEEGATPTGFVIPVPESKVDDSELAADIRNLKGRTVLGETTANAYGEGKSSAPTRDWQPQRLGPVFTAGEVQARTDAAEAVMVAAGIPLPLISPASSASAREGWRQFLHSTIAPLARLIEEELSRVGQSGSIDLSALNAGDIQGKSRSYAALRKGGMNDGAARKICGFAE